MGHHPGETAVQAVGNAGSISPLTWMVIAAILVAVGYFFYWLFFQNKKKW